MTVRSDEWTKTINCEDFAYGHEGYDEKSQKFLDVCQQLIIIIRSTEEWQALPEPEEIYE